MSFNEIKLKKETNKLQNFIYDFSEFKFQCSNIAKNVYLILNSYSVEKIMLFKLVDIVFQKHIVRTKSINEIRGN